VAVHGGLNPRKSSCWLIGEVTGTSSGSGGVAKKGPYCEVFRGIGWPNGESSSSVPRSAASRLCIPYSCVAKSLL
jgi:hypothetical protein